MYKREGLPLAIPLGTGNEHPKGWQVAATVRDMARCIGNGEEGVPGTTRPERHAR